MYAPRYSLRVLLELTDTRGCRDLREQRLQGHKPSAIDTIGERRRHDILDHEDALLRLGTGCASAGLIQGQGLEYSMTG